MRCATRAGPACHEIGMHHVPCRVSRARCVANPLCYLAPHSLLPCQSLTLQDDGAIPSDEGSYESEGAPYETVEAPPVSTAVYTQLFDLRSLLALTGQMIHNTAVWSFLDLKIYPGNPVRHAVYIAIGAVGLLYTGTLGTNFGMLVLPLVKPGSPARPPVARAKGETTPLLASGVN